ncbi:MAG: hypothetical protein KJ725_15890 [Gammaproteobacteria bacterium]|nr:hypothetical protein [Gammaproteobacteria bacterium]
MEKNCRNCHFLSKECRIENSSQVIKFSLTKEERESIKTSPESFVSSHYSLLCHMGVWDEGVSGCVAERDFTINRTKRNSNCFFFPHQQSMLYGAACELQKRSAENAQLKNCRLPQRYV